MCRCGGGDEHEHTVDLDASSSKSLYSFVDFTHCGVLNGRKPFDLQRIIRLKFIEDGETLLSDVDEQIIIKVQFSGTVKIKAITVHSTVEAGAPSEMKAFVNMPDLDFSCIEEKTSAQTWLLARSEDIIEPLMYPTKIFKFSNVNHLTLFFPRNFGDVDVTKTNFIGFYGDYLQNRIGVVHTVYESKPNVADHKQETRWMNSSSTGF